MVDFVKLEETKPKKLTDKQRTHLIILTYMLNFMLYVVLFDLYESFIAKWVTFFLIISFASQMLARQTSISAIHGWTIVYAIINAFAFGLTSMLFSYNLLVIGINLLYFRYIVQRVEVKKD